VSQFAPAGSCGFQRSCRAQARDNFAAGEDVSKRLKQTGFADVDRCHGTLAVRRLIVQCNRLNRPSGFHSRLQQRPMKSQQMRTIRGCPFRKDGDVLAGVQQRVDFGIDESGLTTAAATQEYGIGFCGQPADQRPVTDLGF